MTSIEAARSEDRPAIEALLSENGLPTIGFELALGLAIVALEGGRIVGCAAVERYGSAGLLRSVCVETSHRGTGLGQSLVAQAEVMARDAGIGELFLLTETAAEWFPRLGYVPGDRTDVPTPVLASPEFTGACPDSARVFRKSLDATGVGA